MKLGEVSDALLTAVALLEVQAEKVCGDQAYDYIHQAKILTALMYTLHIKEKQ